MREVRHRCHKVTDLCELMDRNMPLTNLQVLIGVRQCAIISKTASESCHSLDYSLLLSVKIKVSISPGHANRGVACGRRRSSPPIPPPRGPCMLHITCCRSARSLDPERTSSECREGYGGLHSVKNIQQQAFSFVCPTPKTKVTNRAKIEHNFIECLSENKIQSRVCACFVISGG